MTDNHDDEPDAETERQTMEPTTGATPETASEKSDQTTKSAPVSETDGPSGEAARPDPTRYGDWEKNGRCIDF